MNAERTAYVRKLIDKTLAPVTVEGHAAWVASLSDEERATWVPSLSDEDRSAIESEFVAAIDRVQAFWAELTPGWEQMLAAAAETMHALGELAALLGSTLEDADA